MILDLYLTILAIGLILLGISYYLAQFDNIDTTITLRVIGAVFILSMGVTMTLGQIQYETGATIIENNSTTTTITTTTTNYQNQPLGYGLAIVGAIIFALTFLDVKQLRKQED